MKTRIWMGAVMAVLAAGVLAADGRLAERIGLRFYPCLFVAVLLLIVLGCVELRSLLRDASPPLGLMTAGVAACFLANWLGPLGLIQGDPFRHVLYAFAAWVLVGFLYEMATYRPDGGAVRRLAALAWAVAYLGVLPAFFVRLRYLSDEDHARGAAAVGVLIAVTKGCDVGAYFTGRLMGRHPMTPALSPKKTWEGFAGGVAAAVAAAAAAHAGGWGLFGSYAEASAFGAVVGVVGVLGDLAESLVKRDCGAKDASQVVPGFGGVLDVVDSVVFAAPVAFVWLAKG